MSIVKNLTGNAQVADIQELFVRRNPNDGTFSAVVTYHITDGTNVITQSLSINPLSASTISSLGAIVPDLLSAIDTSLGL